MNVLSLFSGVGGIDLGLERAGMQVVAQSEVEPYACKVLRRHWPDTPNLGDITTTEFLRDDTRNGIVYASCPSYPEGICIGRVNIIAGGFPCQDVSGAGARAGVKKGTRSGLWYEYARTIRCIRPRYIVVENVVGLRSKGMEQVLADLAACGYDAWWDTLPAAAFGAPHRRDRVCIVANRTDVAPFNPICGPIEWTAALGTDAHSLSCAVRGEAGDVAGAPEAVEDIGQQREWRGHAVDNLRTTTPHADSAGLGEQWWSVSTQAELAATERDGWWRTEPNVGRVAHGVPSRMDRMRCLGNAVVPQLAQYIGEMVGV